MTPSRVRDRRLLALAELAVSLALLLPGILAPVITVRGYLDPGGLAALAPRLLDDGLSEADVATLRPLVNPEMLPLLERSAGGLKGALVARLGPQIGARLGAAPPIEVYQQTRSIVSSVRYLYRVGSATAATLILLFSVVVPFTKAALVLWAVSHRDPARRRRTLHLVELIAKWSMADVFAVALFIAYLAGVHPVAGLIQRELRPRVLLVCGVLPGVARDPAGHRAVAPVRKRSPAPSFFHPAISCADSRQKDYPADSLLGYPGGCRVALACRGGLRYGYAWNR